MPRLQSLFQNQSLQPNISTLQGPATVTPSGALAGRPASFQGPIAPGTSETLFRGAGISAPPVAGAINFISDSSQQAGFNLGRSTPQAAAPTAGPDDVSRAVSDARQRAQSNLQTNLGIAERGIGAAFSGLQQSLDERLARLSGERGSQEELIGEGVAARRRVAESQRERSLGALAESEREVRETGKRNLRSLAEDIRNQLQAAGQFIGGLGAGDSSAAGLAAGAVGKAGLKQRGLIIERQDQDLRQIDRQRLDVESVTREALDTIEAEKSQQLGQLAQFYSDRISQLEQQKTNATFEQGQQLTQAQLSLQQELQSNLQDLDNFVLDRRNQIDFWNRNRNAQLEDAAARIARAGQFTGLGELSQNLETLVADFMAQGFSRPEAEARAQQELQSGGSDLFIDPEEVRRRQASIFDLNQQLKPTPPSFQEQLAEREAQLELERLNATPGQQGGGLGGVLRGILRS